MDASMTPREFDSIALQTLDELLMVFLERLVRVYGRENVAQIFDSMVPVDRRLASQVLVEALALEPGSVSEGLGSGTSLDVGSLPSFRMEDAMESLTLDGFKGWMDMYGKACENSDPRAAAELFTQNATYYETPFGEPMIGQDAIYQYWSRASQALKEAQFSYEILAVTGNRGIALMAGKARQWRIWQGRGIGWRVSG